MCILLNSICLLLCLLSLKSLSQAAKAVHVINSGKDSGEEGTRRGDLILFDPLTGLERVTVAKKSLSKI